VLVAFQDDDPDRPVILGAFPPPASPFLGSETALAGPGGSRLLVRDRTDHLRLETPQGSLSLGPQGTESRARGLEAAAAARILRRTEGTRLDVGLGLTASVATGLASHHAGTSTQAFTLGGHLDLVGGDRTAWTDTRICAGSCARWASRSLTAGTDLSAGPALLADRRLLAALGLCQAVLLAGSATAPDLALAAGLVQAGLALAGRSAAAPRSGSLLRMTGPIPSLMVAASPWPGARGQGPRAFQGRLHLKTGVASLEAGDDALLRLTRRQEGASLAMAAGGPRRASSAGIRIASGEPDPLGLAPEGLATRRRRGELAGEIEMAPLAARATRQALPQELDLMVGEYLAPRLSAPLPRPMEAPLDGDVLDLWAGERVLLRVAPAGIRASVDGCAFQVRPERLRLDCGPSRVAVTPSRVHLGHGPHHVTLAPDGLALSTVDRLEAGADIQISQAGGSGRVVLEDMVP
jgi:hypothetical protein